MPSLRDEITKTFLRFGRRSPASSPGGRNAPRRDSGIRQGAEIGSYRVIKPLGMGGMGHVFLAHDNRLGRHVALKFLPQELTSEPLFFHRFQQEARTASSLNHPNILTIHDFAEIEGNHIIVSEFVDGVTLRTALERNSIDLSGGVDIVAQVASALVAAHAAGVIHRDLKPANIMVRPDGYVKVIDFGLAKLTQRWGRAGGRDDTWTQPGSVLGTVGYMSPEQARGDEVDERSDIWSLGVILYEIVAKQPPFEGHTDSHLIVSILDSPPQPIPDASALPAGLPELIARALQKDKRQRYQSARELLTDLEGIQRTSRTSPASRIPVIRKPRNPYLLPVTAVILVAAALGIWWWPLEGRFRVLGPTWFEYDRIERLTFDGNVQLATISPDGKRLAYTVNTSGGEVLKIRDLVRRTEESFPGDSDHFDGMTFSADCKSLFYVLRDRKREVGSLFSVPVDALEQSPPNLVLRHIDGPVAFSPDGQSFAFMLRSDIQKPQHAILIAHENNVHDAHAIVTLPETEILPNLGWSARRNEIAAVLYPERIGRPTEPEVSLFTPQGKLSARFPGSAMRTLKYPVPLDSGRLVAFAGRTPGVEQKQLVQLFVPTGQFHALTAEMGSFDSISATRDSSAIAAVRLDNRSSVWVADADDLGRPHAITAEAESYDSLTWMGNEIILPSTRTGNMKLSKIASDGRIQPVSNAEKCIETWPVSVPSTSFLTYSSNCAHGGDDFNIWRLDMRTGQRVALTSGSNLDRNPAPSPDGRWVYYTSSASAAPSIWRVPSVGGSPVSVSTVQARFPFVSADGTKILCQLREPPSDWRVGVISVADGSVVREFPNLPIDALARWAPDGRSIDFVDAQGAQSGIWRQQFNSDEVKPVLRANEDGRIIFFAWNRDGTKLAYIRARAASDAVLFHRRARN